MNQSTDALCQCVISHPTAAKFLVIKHHDGWRPPVALVPDNVPLVNLPNKINQGMLENYGFMTATLRQLASSPGYRCVELDRLSEYGRSGLQAVWVGKKEYQQFRRSDPNSYDPLAAWLEEKQKGSVPEVRPDWEREGWFAEARDWIQKGLETLQINQSGPVEQFRGFRSSSCILRVPTTFGYVYFKASGKGTPNEAALTRALAEKWPGFVEMPLLVDENRNWILSRDYGDARSIHPEYTDFRLVADALAGIQLGSDGQQPVWTDLGCPSVTLKQLGTFAGDLESLRPLLHEGGADMALTGEEQDRLIGQSDHYRAQIEKLDTFGISDMLVHPDLWFSNIIRSDNGVSIHDWAGTSLAHPFFSMLKLLRFRELEQENQVPPHGEPGEEEALIEQTEAAYLRHFEQFGDAKSLGEALALARECHSLWRLHYWVQALRFEEKMTVSYQVVVRRIQRIARTMAATGADAGDNP